MMQLKLVRAKRYVYGDTLFVQGKTYRVKNEMAAHLLAQENDLGIPYFAEVKEETATPKKVTKEQSEVQV